MGQIGQAADELSRNRPYAVKQVPLARATVLATCAIRPNTALASSPMDCERPEGLMALQGCFPAVVPTTPLRSSQIAPKQC